jgi:hypothetical protein
MSASDAAVRKMIDGGVLRVKPFEELRDTGVG